MRLKTLAAALLLAAGAAQAAPVNAGFESGNLTGWTTSLSAGTASVVTSHSTTYTSAVTYTPVEGNHFLAIQAGSAGVWQTVSQSFSMQAGDELSGMAAFNWGDYSPYLDGVMVQILNATGGVVATPFFMDGTGHPSGYDSPWTAWSFSAAAAGTYTLVYGARNTLDGGGPNQTFGYFDAASLQSQVPEPMTLALAGLALMGAGAAGRRSRKN